LTHLDLPELQNALTTKIKEGTVLHGSSRGDLTILQPATSHDAYEHKDTSTAVFATDQPLIALSRGVAGNNMQRWTQQVIFGVNNLTQDNPYGYVYVLPEQGFVPHPNDLSEYLSANPVTPLARMKVSSQSVVPLFRTMEEVDEDINQETGLLDPERVRESDITAALLTLRNMFQLIDYIDYDFIMDSQKGDRLQRLALLTITLKPVLNQFHRLANDEQKIIAREVSQRSEDNNIYAPKDYDPIINLYVDISQTMRKLSAKSS
jgi:hypothetical protein